MLRCSKDRRGKGLLSPGRRQTQCLLAFAVAALLALSGCIGKSTKNPDASNVQSVTLSPSSTQSLEFGKSLSFTGTARDSAGRVVLTGVQYVSDNNAALTISVSGLACAGTWDSLTNPVRCSPGVEGIANVRAVAEGISSPPATIYVHQHIQNVQVTPIGQPTDDCFSEGTIWNFQAQAFGANNIDITNAVGPFTWSSTNAIVVTVDSIKDLPNNQVQVTARTPGITQLFAASSGTISSPLNYTTCLVSSIKLQVQGGSGNTVTLSGGGTKTIEATVVDTLGVTLTKPTLTWATSNAEAATVSTNGAITARQTAGSADISASCEPPACNVGVIPSLPVYSTGGTLTNGTPAFGTIVARVAPSKPPTATGWAGTTDCGTNFNCTSVMFPVAAGTTPVGNPVLVPYTPNSMRFVPSGTRIYMGSDSGLMFIDVGATTPTVSTVSQATTPCNVAVCGKVLAISSDSGRVAVSDTTTVPNQVYIFNAGQPTNPPVDLLIDGAIAAAFSPDELKLFILTNTGKLYVYSTVDALIATPITPGATALSFAADGSFAYVAGEPGSAISGFATCKTQNMGASPALPSNPLLVATLPEVQESPLDADHSVITQELLAIEPPNVQLLTARFTRNPIADGAFTCNTPVFYPNVATGFTAGPSFNLGQGAFTPVLMQVTGDGSQVIIVAKNIPAVLIFDIHAGTTTAIPLANNASPLAASATLDGTQVFVASCDGDPTNPNTCGSIHLVNTQAGGDLQQAVYTNPNTGDSLCNNLPGTMCLPNLIAIKPQ